jgi:hypothetical protein
MIMGYHLNGNDDSLVKVLIDKYTEQAVGVLTFAIRCGYSFVRFEASIMSEIHPDLPVYKWE